MNETRKQELIKRFIEIAKKEIRLDYSECDKTLGATVSKIGGKPAVPADFEWPTYTAALCDEPDSEKKTRPLSFLAQINLKEIAGMDEENLLPKEGLLSFFYELETMTWGFDPEDEGSAKIFYFPKETDLQVKELPETLSEEYIIPELAVNFEERISLPGYGDYDELLDISPDEDIDWDEFLECREIAGGDDEEELTKLLGFPNIIQNPMEEECEACTRGFEQGSVNSDEAIPDDIKTDIAAKAEDWMLLFQMSTVETDNFELMFGDCGSIYFWIRRQDLMERRFDKAWLVLQCF